jgi:hypothetical protein
MADLPNAMASYRAQRVALISGAQNELIATISTAIDKACIKISDDGDIEHKDYFRKYILTEMFDCICSSSEEENNRGDIAKAMEIIERLYCKIAKWNLNNKDTYDKS